MALYLDTSALVKLFVHEPGSDAVEKAVEEDADVHVGWLTPHEFFSAIARRQRTGELSQEQVLALQAELRALLASCVRVVPYSETLSQRALVLLEKYGPEGLRTLDSFQLATGFEARHAQFGVADKLLGEIARKAGLGVMLFG
ncbi:MAG: type II toxin-antitoxin system VapC family toxin [Candidatus Solibacter usitatus]|nr:type II toxin-antitoxin system VapC family toxin [Candidatus Solibacter usitatus]